LSDANANRNPQVFADLASHLMQVTHRKMRRELDRFFM
jgi:hypothetical protein